MTRIGRRWCAALILFLLLPGLALCETEKVVYLTFDDGPKADTPELLALLEELDVPATFFLVGLAVRAYPEYAKQIADAGYPIGCHTMSHSPNRLKADSDYVRRDIERFNQTIQTYVDPNYTTTLYRFPGGSTSYNSSLKKAVRNMGIAWFDWNGMNGDAQQPFYKGQKMIDFAMRTVGQQDVVIMLMHDGKRTTREALPEIVARLREQGYTFRTLRLDETERAFLSQCGANMMLPQSEGEM